MSKPTFLQRIREIANDPGRLMNRSVKTLILVNAVKVALLAAIFISSPACAQSVEITGAERNALVSRLEASLNATMTLQARFSQTNMDGTVESGTFYLWRPGRLRFEYDAPKLDYIVADGLLVHYWDHGVKNYSNAPIGSTLADFLLQKKIKFSGELQVLSLRRPQPGRLVLTINQKKTPEAGDVRLLFDESNLALLKWRVTDGTGNITEVSLSDIRKGIKLNPTLFRFKPPKGYDKEWQDRT